MSELCQRFGISRKTGYKMLQRHAEAMFQVAQGAGVGARCAEKVGGARGAGDARRGDGGNAVERCVGQEIVTAGRCWSRWGGLGTLGGPRGRRCPCAVRAGSRRSWGRAGGLSGRWWVGVGSRWLVCWFPFSPWFSSPWLALRSWSRCRGAEALRGWGGSVGWVGMELCCENRSCYSCSIGRYSCVCLDGNAALHMRPSRSWCDLGARNGVFASSASGRSLRRDEPDQ